VRAEHQLRAAFHRLEDLDLEAVHREGRYYDGADVRVVESCSADARRSERDLS
jgi:hypothetical protein